ncbi:hypothetical protein Rhal01_02023 [Rubritalea halochordaticola]|uniref:Ice-binding protein C-terminal domain-containing protein n=1 Tax=Rubritalea halochordaticola TaxID=714537 RepID=A0ABP9V2M8_9BACT
MMKLTSCLAILSVTSLSVNAANVILNGSFEIDDISNGIDNSGVALGSDGYADNWVNSSIATGGALGSNDGSNRTFTGDDSTYIYQLTSATVEGAGQELTLDFYGNSGAAGRGWVGEIFWTTDGGTTRNVFSGSSITLNMNNVSGDWEQANGSTTSYVLSGADVIAAGIGATIGVQFVGTTGSTFKGLDSVSLDVQAIPEPSSTALIGMAGLGLLLRRRR